MDNPTEEPTEENRIHAALRGIIDGYLAEEGITPALIEYVDLDIAFSPVLAVRGETLDDAASVVQTRGGNYLVDHPFLTRSVSPDELKIMRVRYLLRKADDAKMHGPFAAMYREHSARQKRSNGGA